MLKSLSYLNLIISVSYFLAYLQNASRLVVLGLLAVVIFNWMMLVNLERERFQPSLVQWIFAAVTLFFAVFLGYGAIQQLLDAIGYYYYPGSMILLIAAGLFFTLTILFHLFLSWSRNSVKKDD